MASWSQPKDIRTVKEILRGLRRLVPGEEAGQPCPRCGDLWPWRLTRCKSCGAKLR
jgi:predicted RNA-binding Zn-ribbon protein involved in translation (DUF1610 family)